ncbi:MAG: sigma-54 dependent transcriptional regulator, partial [Candidatus Korobacteraceae bacterium]
PALCLAKAQMTKVAGADCTVLITGETGTGKELAAEFVHSHSPRRGKPFVCVNCAAIPDSLLESELFGHSKGAFTGAEDIREGVFAAADGGTIFLDEVGDMSLFAQAKILRVLERKEVCRLGGTQRRQLDVRFVAATNQDLEAMTQCGSFRKDLFFRLNVARVHLPPLRDRKDDIPLVIDHYCREFSCRAGCPTPTFSQDSFKYLLEYDWPGNIRELKNVLENLFLGEVPGEVHPGHLPAYLRELIEKSCNLSSSERDQLITALSAAQWNKSKAAEILHWSRMTLYRKMAKHQLSRFAPQAAPRMEERGSKAV